MMRLFAGIGLPPDALDALQKAVSALGVRGRMTAPMNYHLTLAFLGEHDERLKPLKDVLSAAARTAAPFTLSVEGFGHFGRLDDALLYAKLGFSKPLQALAGTVRTRLAEAGEPYDEKPFAAHITLARQADLTGVDWQTQLPPIAFPADRLTLYHSLRVQDALRYHPVFEAMFEKEDTLA
jgi:RNA 2',3'-cyclic 3'-phosphodiesterase